MADCDDAYGTAGESLYAAVSRRAYGLYDDSLALAEQAEEALRAGGSAFRVLHSLALIEKAASLLSLGDSAGARALAMELCRNHENSPLAGHQFRIDLIIAETDCREGHADLAIERLAFTLSTWQADPPIGRLRCTFGRSRACSVFSRVRLAWRRFHSGCCGSFRKTVLMRFSGLRRRCCRPRSTCSSLPEWLAHPDRGSSAASSCPTTPTPCRVRLFGGLEVTTEFGIVDENAWRKRKARVLFAMLAVKRGQDVPRDVILEHLWPDMTQRVPGTTSTSSGAR